MHRCPLSAEAGGRELAKKRGRAVVMVFSSQGLGNFVNTVTTPSFLLGPPSCLSPGMSTCADILCVPLSTSTCNLAWKGPLAQRLPAPLQAVLCVLIPIYGIVVPDRANANQPYRTQG